MFKKLWILAAILLCCGTSYVQAQVMKAADLEKYAKHYPFVEKDPQKRTCAKALVMTHAYSNAIIDKVETAIKTGITGTEDDDW